MVNRLRVALLSLAGLAAVVPAPYAAACFPCYCNGAYIGCYNDVWSCYSDCIATPTRSVDPLEQSIFGNARSDESAGPVENSTVADVAAR